MDESYHFAISLDFFFLLFFRSLDLFLDNQQGNDREDAKEEEGAEGKVSEVASAQGVSHHLGPGEESRGLRHLNIFSQTEGEELSEGG